QKDGAERKANPQRGFAGNDLQGPTQVASLHQATVRIAIQTQALDTDFLFQCQQIMAQGAAGGLFAQAMAYPLGNLFVRQWTGFVTLINADEVPAVARGQRAIMQPFWQMLQGAIQFGDRLPGAEPAQFTAILLGRAGRITLSQFSETPRRIVQLAQQLLAEAVLGVAGTGIVRGCRKQDMPHPQPGGCRKALPVGLEKASAGCIVGFWHL